MEPVKQKVFAGLSPSTAPKLLPPESAQVANNMIMRSGRLIPLHDVNPVYTLPDAHQQSIYLYRYDMSQLVCGTNGSILATWQAVTNGCFTYVSGVTNYAITGLNFTGLTFAQIATAIQTGIRAATGYTETVTYDATANCFTLASADDTVGFLLAGTSQIAGSTGTAIGNMVYTGTTGGTGGLAKIFDNITTQGYAQGGRNSEHGTPPATGYAGKDWGSGHTQTLSKAIVYGPSNYQIVTPSTTATLMLQGSVSDGTTWINLMTSGVATTIAQAQVITLTASGANMNTACRYHRVLITPVATPAAAYAAEIQFFSTGGAGTDIGTATYLNGQAGGTATQETAEFSQWLSWPSNDIDVVRSPTNEDSFRRIYWTGETTKLRMMGLFDSGTPRNVGVAIPTDTGVITVTDLVTYAWACSLTGTDGTTPFTQACTLTKTERTPDGWIVTFNLSAFTTTCAAVPTWGFTCGAFAGFASKTVADIGVAGTPIVDTPTGITWSTPTVLGIDNDTTFSHTGVIPSLTCTWTACTVTFTIDMAYYYPSTRYMYYLMSYVTDLFEEGPASPISDLVTAYPDQMVYFTVIPLSADPTIKTKRIYRTGVSSTGAQDAFYFDVELPNATIIYTDSMLDEALSEEFVDRQNPPEGLRGLISLPGGFLAAFIGQDVWMSEPDIPSSWPSKYMVSVDAEIVGLANTGNDIIVLTKENPFVISGSAPELMRPTKLNNNYACVSKRGIAKVGNVVMYPSAAGLVQMLGGLSELITKKTYNHDTFGLISPSLFISAGYDNRYHAFNGTQGYIFDFTPNITLSAENYLFRQEIEDLSKITTNDEVTAGMFADIENDALYLIQGNKIVQWDSAATYMTATYRNRELQLPRPWCWNCVQIIADAYTSLTLNLYAENVQVLSMPIYNYLGKQLPHLRPERVWSYEIVFQDPVDEVQLATSMKDLQA
jgi:hypothetical protein